jgi:hypothetical protein
VKFRNSYSIHRLDPLDSSESQLPSKIISPSGVRIMLEWILGKQTGKVWT